MRVVSGTARGRKLISLEGLDVRPTTDKVKESMFNIIQFELEGGSVLDLFAGSGQLGIEALSRGAAKATFVDSSKKSLETVRRNIELTGFGKIAKTVNSDAFSFLAGCNERFDIILLDPPYEKNLCDKAFEYLPNVLKPTSVIICETRATEKLPGAVGSFTLYREYVYSAIKLSVFRTETDGE